MELQIPIITHVNIYQLEQVANYVAMSINDIMW